MPSTSGLLNVNKPAGITSRTAVDLVQRLARSDRVGHAGTLDPLATGVLIVCVGQATRLIQYVQRMPKRYVGTFLLGRRSPTEDVDGEVETLVDPPIPSRSQVEAAAAQFVGRLMQRPPAFSALKVSGRRAYDLARRGEEVQLQPRLIEVYSLTAGRYEYPELVLEICCSGGTYVRSLGRDIAESLGTCTVMSALVRTAIGPWQVSDAVDPRGLTSGNWRDLLQPLRKAVADLPVREVSDAEVARLRQGLFIEGDPTESGDELAAIDGRGRLAAILVRRGPQQWGPAKNLD